jgi:DNA-binding XRE family transcriptional regulator
MTLYLDVYYVKMMQSSTASSRDAAVVSPSITPRSTPDRQLAAALRRLREQRGLSRETLAHSAGLTLGGYVRIEQAKASPGWGTVRRLAEALGVSLDELGREVEAEGG